MEDSYGYFILLFAITFDRFSCPISVKFKGHWRQKKRHILHLKKHKECWLKRQLFFQLIDLTYLVNFPFQFCFEALPDEADNDVLLELTDQKLNIGNPQHAKDSIAEIEFENRLDQDINQIRTTTMPYEPKHVLNDRDDRESVEETHVDATIVEKDTQTLGKYQNYKI